MKTFPTNVTSFLVIVSLWMHSAQIQAADPTTSLKEAYKGSFLIGTAVNRTMTTNTAARPDSGNRTADQITLINNQFNQISPENDLKWQLIHPAAGPDGYNWGPADAFVEFGAKNNMYLVGHTLVWHGQTPNWVFQGTAAPATDTAKSAEAEQKEGDGKAAAAPPGGRRGPRGFTGPMASRDELLQRMRDHIHAVVARYKGKIKAWDVVNEALADGDGEEVLRNSMWRQIIGDDFIAKAFQYAHEADPDCILRYNDYGLENPNKRRRLMTLIKQLKEQGVPIHAIGTQAHLNVSSATFDSMDKALTEIATLGLPIHVTELDINSARSGQRDTGADIAANASATQGGLVDEANQRLADAYASTFRAFLKHKQNVKVVTFWGVNDAVSWRRNGKPLLFDGNNQPKTAFNAVIRVVKSD